VSYKRGMTYTVVDDTARHRGDLDATVVYEGFTNYRTGAEFVAIADHNGEIELWSVEMDWAADGQPKPSAHGIAELRAYYRGLPDGHRVCIFVYRNIGKR
jgi:hypothetical protein